MSDHVVHTPIHALDLDLNSLIVIYKRFEEAKRLTCNPNQELPTEQIVQLVCQFINQEPSHLQKQIQKSIYKKTISWNDFLHFLDKESEARDRILNWIMYQTNIKQFRFWKRLNLSHLPPFEQITLFQPTMFESRPHRLLLLDKTTLVVYEAGKTEVLASLTLPRQKYDFANEHTANSLHTSSSQLRIPSQGRHMTNQSTMLPRDSTRKVKGTDQSQGIMSSNNNKANHSVNTYRRQEQSGKINTTEQEQQWDQDAYLFQERKKISSIFQVFKQLPINEASSFASQASQKLQQRRLCDLNLTDIRQTYHDALTARKQEQADKTHAPELGGASQRLTSIRDQLRRMAEDKRKLTYNPRHYSTVNQPRILATNKIAAERKRINFEKKDKLDNCLIGALAHHPQTHLIAAGLFNFQIVLIKLSREFNKTAFTVLDRAKVARESDHKKYEVIEAVTFHSHTIANKLQVLVAVRVDRQGYIRCYGIDVKENLQKSSAYAFSKDSTFVVLPFECTLLISEPEFGFHVVGAHGHFRCYKDDFNHGKDEANAVMGGESSRRLKQSEYYSLHYSGKLSQRIKVSSVALSRGKKRMAFGTLGGEVIVIHHFTKDNLAKLRASSKSVVHLVFDDPSSQLFVMSADQIVTIYDSTRLVVNQILKVKNEVHLNEKASMFATSTFKNQVVIHCYGSEVQQFISRVEEDLETQKRQIETTYKWRLKRADKVVPTVGTPTSQQIIGVASSDAYIVVITKSRELRVISKKSYKIKHSLVLSLPCADTIIGFSVSPDCRLLALTTESSLLRVKNIFTQQIYRDVRTPSKLTHVEFLSERNQYFLVGASEFGKLSFYPSYNNKSLNQKTVPAHSRSLTAMVMVGDLMLTAAEDAKLLVWQMPFNVIRHQILLDGKLPRQHLVSISQTRNPRRVICKGLSGILYDIDTKEGAIKDAYDQLAHVHLLNFYYNEDNNQLHVVDQDLNISIFEMPEERSTASNWKASISPTRQNPDSRRTNTLSIKKQSRTASFRKRDESIVQNQVISRLKPKLLGSLSEKGVEFCKIQPNSAMKSVVYLLSRDCFYVYDSCEEKFKNKYSYNGECQQHDSRNLLPPPRHTAR